MEQDWDHIRRTRYSPNDVPPDWPDGVKGISMNGAALLGVHAATNQLYWDGQPLVTERRLATFERIMAGIVTASTAIVAVVEVGRAVGWITL
ncbi:hypothetical protein [Allomesorhizobium camelthorni]|uniref:Uncharacterized protein n=1 Tax=Allomesorhizobium camelthorni TaxID=475069 RepID=A0A6G4WEZ3_9HYPH|nr:hypothetical protein [Mesorhizobium camelthorni]NGO53179.1 hypothetical protein [Mesorhizobium camelthorni]